MPSDRTKLMRAGLLLASALIAMQMLGAPPTQAQRKAVPKKKTAATPVAPLALSLKTDQHVYHADSNIRFTLTAKNTTHEEMVLRFNSGQRYDFELFRGKDAKGDKVWQWAKGMMFTMALSAAKLEPGKSLVFTETYRPGSDAMVALTPGAYTVVATLKGVSKTTTPPLSMPCVSTTFQVN